MPLVLALTKNFLKEFWQFLWERKLWWMLPLVIVFLLFGVLVLLAQSSSVAPFIYVMF